MKRRWIVILEITLPLALVAWIAVSLLGHTSDGGVSVKVRVRGAQENAELVRKPDGAFQYNVAMNDGSRLALSPQELAERTFRDEQGMKWWMRFLNITGPFGLIWVTVGLLGQVLFTGRMIVQWIVSERHKKSVVPPVFWWMSLVGATMLVVYFLWRRDPIGILGQAVGWFVYVRNLWLIYHSQQPVPVGEDPAPEPELTE